MKATALLASLLLVGLAGSPALAIGSPECGLIRDPDKRRLCFALQDRRPGDCSLIRDSDERRLCRAAVERTR